jgi:hypothetical protein
MVARFHYTFRMGRYRRCEIKQRDRQSQEPPFDSAVACPVPPAAGVRTRIAARAGGSASGDQRDGMKKMYAVTAIAGTATALEMWSCLFYSR